MVFADGKVTEFEDNVLWRAADLLGISGRDRIDSSIALRSARRRVPRATRRCRGRHLRHAADPSVGTSST